VTARWTIRVTTEVRAWLRELSRTSPNSYLHVNAAIDALAVSGPALGRPLVDTIAGSNVHNLKELRSRSGRRVSIRILFVFDPWSQAILLTGGDKAGNWKRWYDAAIPRAEKLLVRWLEEERDRRAKEENGGA
jgi:hypothetical protein